MTNETMYVTPQPGNSSGSGAGSKNVMTAADAAILLEMDPRTLIRWSRSGYVPAHPLGEGRRRMWRFFRDELLAWVAAQSNLGRTA